MQKKKTILFLFGIVCFLSGTVLRAQSVRLAVEQALQNNNQLKAEQEAVVQARLKAKAAFRETLPGLDFEASYNHVTDVPELRMPTPMGVQTIRLGTFDKYEAGLSVNYVLFSGFAQQNNIRLKELQKDLSAVRLKSSQKEIAFQTIRAYRQVQMLLLTVDIYKAAEKRVGLKLNDVRTLVKQGMALAVDTLSLRLSLLDAQQNRLNMESRLELAQQQLDNLTGTHIVVQREETSPHKTPEAIWTPEQNLRLQALNKQIRLAQATAGLAESPLYPHVALYAAYKYGKPGLDMISNEWMAYGVWGAGLSWNLFNWQKDALTSQAAQAKARELAFRKQVAKEQLKLGFDQAESAYRFLQHRWQLQRQAVELAKAKMQTIQSRYKRGMASATDFNMANLELTQAELKEAQQRIQLALKCNELEYKSDQPISEWSMQP